MKKAVLLLNMGGPNNLDEVSVFLKNMFNDKYILNIKNEKLRDKISSLIAFLRKKPATKNYELIGGKSPLVDITASLVEKLSKTKEYDFDFIMRYTPPFAKDVLKKYKGYDEIVLFPLYPHHSITTVVSSLEDAKDWINELNINANVKIIDVFFNDLEYNKIIINSIKNEIYGINENEVSDIALIFSAHSLPKSIIKNGDLYERNIKAHVDILSNLIKKEGINFKDIKLAYQSRLGPVKWLEPNLSFVLPLCASKKALIYPLSFCIDNSETICELNIEYRKIANKSGFKYYRVCKCPNDSDKFVNFIVNKVQNL
ncbi:ferrochelatase [Campylobacter ureolyticus]|uniref:ferrochelatase n=1 Tax=Campylobacter ureolyticus TaxID=827 RepID=UPI0022B52B61|nr:ferrochelatase [Campylobacter ureolyticus]MCZ6172986.1 ferrochelatase [Campylobacter ureolyticus]